MLEDWCKEQIVSPLTAGLLGVSKRPGEAFLEARPSVGTWLAPPECPIEGVGTPPGAVSQAAILLPGSCALNTSPQESRAGATASLSPFLPRVLLE